MQLFYFAGYILVLQGCPFIVGQGVQVPVFLYTVLYIGDKTLFHYYIAHLVENCANIRVYIENANF